MGLPVTKWDAPDARWTAVPATSFACPHRTIATGVGFSNSVAMRYQEVPTYRPSNLTVNNEVFMPTYSLEEIIRIEAAAAAQEAAAAAPPAFPPGG